MKIMLTKPEEALKPALQAQEDSTQRLRVSGRIRKSSQPTPAPSNLASNSSPKVTTHTTTTDNAITDTNSTEILKEIIPKPINEQLDHWVASLLSSYDSNSEDEHTTTDSGLGIKRKPDGTIEEDLGTSSKMIKLPPKIGDPSIYTRNSPITELLPADRRKRNILQGEHYNNDFCSFCLQSADEFICCESCPSSFHYCCATPPIDPEAYKSLQHWYCYKCRTKNNTATNTTTPIYTGFFAGLLKGIERINPIAFSLPEDIRTFFEGCSYDEKTGDYVDEAANKSRTRLSLYDQLDLLNRLPTGPSTLCQLCGLSGIKGPILLCDYCPLMYHLDCLTPPLTQLPTGGRRWKCPAHVGYQSGRKIKGRHEVLIVDPWQSNDGDIDVIVKDQFEVVDRRRRVRYKVPEESIRMRFIDKVSGKEDSKEAESGKVNAPEGLEGYYNQAVDTSGLDLLCKYALQKKERTGPGVMTLRASFTKK